MKKSVLILIIFSVSLLFSSCGISPDQMLENFNSDIYEDVGGGIYETQNGASVNTGLIKETVIPVSIKEKPYARIEVSPAYYDYKWILKDNSTKEECEISGHYIVYIGDIGQPKINFKSHGEYTITLLLRNRDGVLFTDSATIKVVD